MTKTTKIKFQKSSNNYSCEICDYNTSRLSQYDRHVMTSKHLILTQTNEMEPKSSNTNYTCDCGKQYIHASSLWNHKKKCVLPPVHVQRAAFHFGLLTRKQQDWKAVEELSANLLELDSKDPIKYDLALFKWSEAKMD